MDMTGERRIAAPRQVVWDALNDPAVLKASIPGCESLEKVSDTQMKATASVKIGPISARFTGNVQLTDIDPPNGYNIGGEGQGGVAGFAKGGAKVTLAEEGGATLLRYEVHAQVGGKLAQLGARLIDATAKQMADAFFTRFSAQVESASAPAEAPLSAPAEAVAAALGSPAAVGPVPPATPARPATTQPAAATTQPAAATTQPAAATGHPAAQPEPLLTGATAIQATSQGIHARAAATPPAPPSSISMFDLIPREPFGLPLAFWLGSGVFVLIVLLFLASSL